MQQLLRIIWHDKKTVILALSAGTISGITAVALFAQSGLLISKAALMPPFYIILILTAFLKLFGVTKSASKYAERLLSHRVTFSLIGEVRSHFFHKLLPQAHVLNNYKSGDLLTRITNDVEQLQNFFLRVLYPPLVAVFVFITTILFTLFFSFWVSLLLMLGLICTSIIVPYIVLKRQVSSASVQRNTLSIETTEYLYGYRDLLLHNELQVKSEQLTQLYEAYSQARQKEINEEQSGYVWNQAVALVITFVIVFVSAYLASTGQIEGVYLTLITLVSLTVFESAVPLSMVPTYMKHTQSAIDQLEQVTNSEVNDGKHNVKSVNTSILFEKVSYYYPNSYRAAVENISFQIKAGQKIAIVGPSGSGKSTLLQLLMAEIPPTFGKIFIGHQSLTDLRRESIYTRMSIMLQHNHFFSGTIRSNLLFAKPNATDKQLQDALQKALLQKDLDDNIQEKGGNLSGGEKQRLAFARLLLKESDLWLVDEPFTSLDIETERQLQHTLLAEAQHKTMIAVTHNLQHLHEYDKIYVMQNGKIVESGTEQALMQHKGLLYAMKYGLSN